MENEYGYYERDYGEGGKRYAQWSASMAVSQNIGVPWMMCQQWDAPSTVVSLYQNPKHKCQIFDYVPGFDGFLLFPFAD